MSTWKSFLAHYEKKITSSVLLPVLKQTSLKNIANNVATIACENRGIALFLQTKRKQIEEAFSAWLGKKASLSFFVQEKKTKRKKDGQGPLLKFQPNKPQPTSQTGLQSNFSFENFAVSPANQIAHAAAVAVSESPTSVYNPLLIYGGVGVGKTHLLQAIGNKMRQRRDGCRLYYCTSEDFTNDLVELIRAKNTARFRKKYRSLDVLLVDDIQFLAGKNYVQEEFYHTFNALIRSGGQVVLTSDRSPNHIKKLEDRLKSRFFGGLMIDVQKPDFELRCAILLIKAREKNIQVDMEAVKLLAEHVSDARELEGRLLKIYSKNFSQVEKITLAAVREDLAEKREKTKNSISPSDIIKTVCSYYEVSLSQIKGASRKEKVVLPRQVAMFILRRTLKLKFEEIAYLLKRKDHTTIMHGVDKITNRVLKNASFKEEVNKIVELTDLST